MPSVSLYALLVTLFLHILPLWSYTYGFLKLRPREASETKVFLTSAIVRFEMCPSNEFLNKTCNQEFAAIKANFGPSSNEEIVGSYVAIQPRDACDNDQMTEAQDSMISSSVIALISKGNCSFDTKVANAEKAGFHAAIIYAFKDDTNLIAMESSIPAVPVSIPAYYVSHNTGTALVYTSILANFSRSTLLSISTQREPLAPKGASILRGKKKEEGQKNRMGDNLADMDLEGDIEYQDKCPICHEEFHEGYLVRQLPCNHCYHNYCVDRWLVKMSNRCPLCKQRVSVSLLCSWSKQRDRENLSQSTAEAEAEAAAGELPPLPPIQSLTPKSLYGETIMSGPSKFIILRPGRPTRIIEAPKKEERETVKTSSRDKVDTRSVPVKHDCESSSHTWELYQSQQLVSCNDITSQLPERHASSSSPTEHINLECFDREADSPPLNSPLRNFICDDEGLPCKESSSAVTSPFKHSSTIGPCECSQNHMLWLNKPEDVVSPLLTTGSSDCAISCAECDSKLVGGGQVDIHPSRTALVDTATSVNIENCCTY